MPAAAYRIDPACGQLRLRTSRQGVAARVGHDLVIEAVRWHGTVTVPEADVEHARVAVTVELSGLEVRAGTGGVKPLTDADRREIRATMLRLLAADRHPEAIFESVSVRGEGTTGTVEGTLTVAGNQRPLRLRVEADGQRITGTATVVQSEWGIKPYSAFFGALKLRDEVEVEVEVTLTG